MPPDVAVALAVVPLVAAGIALSWHAGPLAVRLVAGAAAIALLAWSWPVLRGNVTLIYFVQHAGINLSLAAVFGRTLFGPHEPLITRFARMARVEALSPVTLAYCRKVTLAWTIFFLAMAALSTLLFAFAPADAWSLFANLLTMPLVLAMFIAEQLTRNRLPKEDRTGFADTLRAYRAMRRQKASPLTGPP
jgi:uncharacterized membrane protein